MTSSVTGLLMPDEASPHARTWMAFGPSKRIWGTGLTGLYKHAQRDLARIANAIVEFEPVSMLVRVRWVIYQTVKVTQKEELKRAKKLCDSRVDLVVAEMDDLWIRDSGPVFVVDRSTNQKLCVSFNFNGWGNKQVHAMDAKVPWVVAAKSGVECKRSQITLEGGSIEVDGEGTAIISESCVLNDNRNPQTTRNNIETELMHLLGLTKIIWIPGVAGEDITDGHTDFYARFVGKAKVVVGVDEDPKSFDHQITKKHIEVLKRSTDALGRPIEVVTLTAPSFKKLRYLLAGDDFAAGYVNFYVANGGAVCTGSMGSFSAVFVPQFGDKSADEAARAVLASCFPERKVVALNIDAIAAGGGGIHCCTQQEPAVRT